jgi:diguanylate cyclase (GGDEF)-like protein
MIQPSEAVDIETAPDRFDEKGACLVNFAGRLVAADAAVRNWLFRGGLPHAVELEFLDREGALASAVKAVFAPDGEGLIHGYLFPPNYSSALRFTVRRLNGELGPLALVEFQAIGASSEVFTDALTGLPERRAIPNRIAAWALEAAGGPATMAVLFLDLDDFRVVNDGYGHAVGDQVLVELAKRWQRCVREGDLIARYGGDEFVVLLKSVASTGDAEPIVRRLLDATAEPLDLGGTKLRITATVGSVAGPADCEALVKLIDAADRDMYARKRCKAR